MKLKCRRCNKFKSVLITDFFSKFCCLCDKCYLEWCNEVKEAK